MKSSIYSDRMNITMAGELIGWNGNLAFKAYGKEFRYGRRVYHQEFGNNISLVKFQASQDKEATKLLKGLIQNPKNFAKLTSGYVLLCDCSVHLLSQLLDLPEECR